MSRTDNNSYPVVRFGDVVREVTESTRTAVADGFEYFIGLDHLDPESLKIRRWGLIEGSDTTFTKVFRTGQVLFARRRAYQRKAALAEFDGICSGDIIVMEAKPDRLLPELLPFIVQTEGFYEYALSTSAGSLSPRTKWSSLAKYEFPLPPMDEQRRIAEILWTMEEAIEHSRVTVSNAIIARNVLVKELSLENANGVQTKWEHVKIGTVAQVLDPNPSHRYPPDDPNGIPLIATSDFDGEDGYSFEKCQYVPSTTYFEQLTRCNFQEDDIVFARKGVIGHARKYGIEKKTFSHTIAIIKPDRSRILSDFLLWVMRSRPFLRTLDRMMNSNSGVPTLGLGIIRDTCVPLPSLPEQMRISSAANHINSVREIAIEHIASQLDLKRGLLRHYCG